MTVIGLYCVLVVCNREVVGLTFAVFAIKWLLCGWVTVCSQVNYISI